MMAHRGERSEPARYRHIVKEIIEFFREDRAQDGNLFGHQPFARRHAGRRLETPLKEYARSCRRALRGQADRLLLRPTAGASIQEGPSLAPSLAWHRRFRYIEPVRLRDEAERPTGAQHCSPPPARNPCARHGGKGRWLPRSCGRQNRAFVNVKHIRINGDIGISGSDRIDITPMRRRFSPRQ